MPTPPVPGQPHPDVAIMRRTLEDIQPGQVLPYTEAAKALQLEPCSRVFFQRTTAARKQLERDGIVIVCVPGEGFLRELPGQTKDRVAGRETRSVQRKVKRNFRQLSSVDPTKIPENERPELYALMTIQRAVQVATAKPARQKLIAACSVTSTQLAISQALAILSDRKKETD